MTGIAIAAPDGAGAYLDPAALTPDDERALGDWLRRAGPPQGAARRQGTDARAGIARIRSGWTDLGHRAGRLPRAARPAHLRPCRPCAALPRQGAERPRRRQRAAHPGRVGRGGGGARARPARPGDPRPRRRARRGPGEARRHPAAARDRAAARHRPGRDGADRHRGRHRSLRGDVRDAVRRGEGRRAGGVRGRRPRVQPRLAQAAAGGPVHRARPAEDQADQDRLHDRLRGADEPARVHRAPGPRAPAAPPRRGQAEVDRRHR